MNTGAPYIIPFYIPFRGCKSKCIYCNSAIATYGEHGEITQDSFDRRIGQFLSTRRGRGSRVEAAFYGGSFNRLETDEMDFYLELYKPHLRARRVDSLRVSVRPDNLDGGFLENLSKYGLKAVELGVQSMNDAALKAIERGNSSGDIRSSFRILKKFSVHICAHLMVGLPGEGRDEFFNSLHEIINLRPDSVRLHPTLVLKGTVLEDLYKSGKYEPLSLDDALSICREAYVMMKKEGIDVVRFGIQANDILSSGQGVTAGPYHPSFGEMVYSGHFLDRIRQEIMAADVLLKAREVEIRSNPSQVSQIKGIKSAMTKKLKSMFGYERVWVKPDKDIVRDSFQIIKLS